MAADAAAEIPGLAYAQRMFRAVPEHVHTGRPAEYPGDHETGTLLNRSAGAGVVHVRA